MRIKSTAPGRMHVIVEEGDPVVLTDIKGIVVAGPNPAPPTMTVVFDYKGCRVDEFCWGVLNPDGTLAWQSMPQGGLYGYDRVTVELEQPVDGDLTPADRKWLTRVAGFLR